MTTPRIMHSTITPIVSVYRTKTSAAPCCGPTLLPPLLHVVERGAASESADTSSGRPTARATLRRTGKALGLAAENLGPQLLKLLARLGFDHGGADDRRDPHLRNEFPVIDDLAESP